MFKSAAEPAAVHSEARERGTGPFGAGLWPSAVICRHVCSVVKGVGPPAIFGQRTALCRREEVPHGGQCRVGHKPWLHARTTACSTIFTYIV